MSLLEGFLWGGAVFTLKSWVGNGGVALVVPFLPIQDAHPQCPIDLLMLGPSSALVGSWSRSKCLEKGEGRIQSAHVWLEM